MITSFLIQLRKSGSCTLWQSADQYVMRGPTGEHRLSREATDLHRLHAHWKGFCENNGESYLPDIEAGNETQVFVNQGWRDAQVLAVLGNKALVEYEMPNGTTAMLVFEHAMGKLMNAGEIAWQADSAPLPQSVSYRRCPRKWIHAMRVAGMEWIGNSQAGTVEFPKREG